MNKLKKIFLCLSFVLSGLFIYKIPVYAKELKFSVGDYPNKVLLSNHEEIDVAKNDNICINIEYYYDEHEEYEDYDEGTLFYIDSTNQPNIIEDNSLYIGENEDIIKVYYSEESDFDLENINDDVLQTLYTITINAIDKDNISDDYYYLDGYASFYCDECDAFLVNQYYQPTIKNKYGINVGMEFDENFHASSSDETAISWDSEQNSFYLKKTGTYDIFVTTNGKEYTKSITIKEADNERYILALGQDMEDTEDWEFWNRKSWDMIDDYSYANGFNSFSKGKEYYLCLAKEITLCNQHSSIFTDVITDVDHFEWSISNDEVASYNKDTYILTFNNYGETIITCKYFDKEISTHLFIQKDANYVSVLKDTSTMTTNKYYLPYLSRYIVNDGQIYGEVDPEAPVQFKNLLTEDMRKKYGVKYLECIDGIEECGTLLVLDKLANQDITYQIVAIDVNSQHHQEVCMPKIEKKRKEVNEYIDIHRDEIDSYTLYHIQTLINEECDCALYDELRMDLEVTKDDNTSILNEVPVKVSILQDTADNNGIVLKEIRSLIDEKGISENIKSYLEWIRKQFLGIDLGVEVNKLDFTNSQIRDLNYCLEKIYVNTVEVNIKGNDVNNVEGLYTGVDLLQDEDNNIKNQTIWFKSEEETNQENLENINNYAQENNMKILKSYDLTVSYAEGLEKNNETGEEKFVTETNHDLTITMTLPKNYDPHKELVIIRNHDGKVDIIEGYSINDNKVTFKTNKFSTYSFAELKAKSISGAEFEVDDCEYTGQPITPNIETITLNGQTLKVGTDYTISYENNINVGKAIVTLTGIGNYTGTLTNEFNITAKNIQNAKVETVDDMTYTGNELKPEIKTITLDGKTLKLNTDYTISYSNNINVGKAIVTLTGIGNYTKTVEKTFEIKAKDITNAEVRTLDDVIYTGTKFEPEIKTIRLDKVILNNGSDFTVSYEDNLYAGKAKVTISGTKNYTGQKIIYFNINPKNINVFDIDAIENQTYDGNKKEPDVNINGLMKDIDFIIKEYINNIDAGLGKVIVQGINNYTGEIEKEFTIHQKSINQARIENIQDIIYTGKEVEPEIKTITLDDQTLKIGTDYTISYKNNINVGKATVTLTGIGNYTGTVTKEFNITAKSISNAEVEIVDDMTYTGNELKPEMKTILLDGKTLKLNTDYTISYGNNIDVGTATMILTGKGNYKDTITQTFVINPRNIKDMSIKEIDNVIYNGQEQKPEVIVNGLNQEDYTVQYKDNINAGEAKVIVNGIGNYTGTLTKTFIIDGKDIQDVAIEDFGDIIYTGQLQMPVNIAGLEMNKDYKVLYENNINAGMAKATIIGIGNYKGSYEIGFTIQKALMDVVANGYTGVYDGKEHSITFDYLPEGSLVQYRMSEDDEWSEVLPTMIDAGTTTIYYQITNPNYETVMGSVDVVIDEKVEIKDPTIDQEENQEETNQTETSNHKTQTDDSASMMLLYIATSFVALVLIIAIIKKRKIESK